MKSKRTKKKKAVKAVKRKTGKKKIVKKRPVKRKAVKKAVKKKVVRSKKLKAKPVAHPTDKLQAVGEMVHYFPQVKAGVIKITKDKISVGDTLYIKGHTSDFKQPVTSLQIDHVPVKEAGRGEEIGLLVKSRVRVGDKVYKI